jgi:hypothetical protein
VNAALPWSGFFVITGSSAGALTGLTFIVITLVAGQERAQKAGRDGVEAFSSPTVVDFCVALLVSALLAAPWPTLALPGAVLALTGLGGAIYALRVVGRMIRMSRNSHTYLPDLEDWFWYTAMPVTAFLAVLAGGLMMSALTSQALFVEAGATLLLIFVGIRNAWDTVTFIAVELSDQDRNRKVP